MTPSGVSRAVSRLEQRLGVQLLQRTTRSIGLSDEGAAYYERCTRILAELEDANQALASTSAAPRGRLRVDAPLVLGQFVLGPAIAKFVTAHRELTVDLSFRDQLIDPIAEGIDVVLRMTELGDSELSVRKLASVRTVVVGSPAYFARRGRPHTPADLRKHDCITYLMDGSSLPWRLRGHAGEQNVAVVGGVRTNSGDTLRELALAGVGLIQVFEYLVQDALRDRRLEQALVDHEPKPRVVSALYQRKRQAVPKVRAFLDFVSGLFASQASSKTRPNRERRRQ